MDYFGVSSSSLSWLSNPSMAIMPPIFLARFHTRDGFVIFRGFFGGLSDVLRDLGDSGVKFDPVSHYKGTDQEVVNYGGTAPRARKHAPNKQEKLQQVIQRNPFQENFQEIHRAENHPVREPFGIIRHIANLDCFHRRVRRKHEAKEVAKKVCRITNCQVEQDETETAKEQSLSPDISCDL
ncbi:hypothetical protein OS493_005492 [Desmophyllum pertusum]|uniref:Uncharacterized protein n=1 Tax=Desmophyllum pertusum TaxID=174260 RepID=A0A9X0CMA5_9CNID|nr:hypothetical protein OS493_005492 [Desmophyllum pertusum]